MLRRRGELAHEPVAPMASSDSGGLELRSVIEVVRQCFRSAKESVLGVITLRRSVERNI